MPPNSRFGGHTYAEWSEKWWLWDLSLPIPQNPSATPTVDCKTGQEGNHVIFLVGVVGPPTTIHCTVPPGTALFFPIVNAECSNLENPPFFGDTPEARAECAKIFVDNIPSKAAVIDGRVVENVLAYRVQSGDFDFTVPDNNILGVPGLGAASGSSSADGFYLLLHPLSAGTHTIQIVAAGTGFTINTEIILTVGK